jgi:hypothetical protein
MVSVKQKMPASALSAQEIIPQQVEGVPTDVVETGIFRALDPIADTAPQTGRYRPAQPGISVGHYKITTGTLGLLVQRGDTTYILSNNHVLANINDARAGDPILQPGPIDGGTPDDQIATLTEFEPLDFGEQEGSCDVARSAADFLNALASLTGSQHRLQAVQKTPGENLLDAALAQIDAPDIVIPQILGIGTPIGVGEPQLLQTIQKSGRTTGLTQGTVEQIDVTVNVDYNGQQAFFTDQFIAGPMSQPGDSGSAILDQDRNVVGLLFAGSNRATIFTPIQRVLDHFGVTVITA